MSFQSYLEVHLSALRHNVRVLKNIAGSGNCIYPVVKSNAYGLGSAAVMRSLLKEGLQTAAVNNVTEAYKLKELDSQGLKCLLLWPFSQEEASVIVENSHWKPVIGSFEHLERLRKAHSKMKNRSLSKKPHCIHLKIDIGMSRFGFCEKDVSQLISILKEQNDLHLEGVCAHLPGGRDIGCPEGESQKQMMKFKKITELFLSAFPKTAFHFLNSIGVVGCHVYDIPIKYGCRIGGGLYGIKHAVDIKTSSAHKKWLELNLQPVSSFKSRIDSLKQIDSGQKVSYGGEWKASRPSKIAVVPVGYADGLLKSGKEDFVLCRGKKTPIVGRIFMNGFMIDVTEIDHPKAGEEVVIYGEQNGSVKKIEDWMFEGGSAYELMSRIHLQIPRIYKGET